MLTFFPSFSLAYSLSSPRTSYTNIKTTHHTHTHHTLKQASPNLQVSSDQVLLLLGTQGAGVHGESRFSLQGTRRSRSHPPTRQVCTQMLYSWNSSHAKEPPPSQNQATSKPRANGHTHTAPPRVGLNNASSRPQLTLPQFYDSGGWYAASGRIYY